MAARPQADARGLPRTRAVVALIDAIRHGTTTLVDHHASPGAVRGSLGRHRRGGQASRRAGLPVLRAVRPRRRRGRPRRASTRTSRSSSAAGASATDRTCGRCSACTRRSRSRTRRWRAPPPAGRELGRRLPRARRRGRVGPGAQRARARDARGRAPPPVRRSSGPRSIAAHCVHVDDARDRAARRNRHRGRPQPAVQHEQRGGRRGRPAMLAQGVLVGLGTDAMTTNMLEELRAAPVRAPPRGRATHRPASWRRCRC